VNIELFARGLNDAEKQVLQSCVSCFDTVDRNAVSVPNVVAAFLRRE
jgi:hypothetical protein